MLDFGGVARRFVILNFVEGRERERETEREKFCREFQVSNVEQICLREQEIVDKEKVFSTSLDPEIFC